MTTPINNQIELQVVQGEDYVAQMVWTDEYNNPVPCSSPAMMDVVDATGSIVLRFVPYVDPTSGPCLTMASAPGTIQISIPAAWTSAVPAGTYACDLFATAATNTSPFVNGQLQQVFSGTLVMYPRITKLETNYSASV